MKQFTVGFSSFVFLLLTILFLETNQTAAQTINQTSLQHFTGGFSIESDAAIQNAAANGIQSTLLYGYSPDPTDSVGKSLAAHNMTYIDDMPFEYLYYYECHLNNTCSASTFPELTSTQALMTDITNHLKQEQNNSMIVGYWVLDDWNFGTGTGKDLLVQINTLIHQYTPSKPSICGFGGGIPPLPAKGGLNAGWDDQTAANFSPSGCDMVGLYIYASSGSSGTYDWTMANILPAVFTSLKNRGWDITKEPLVGIPQAFGGSIKGEQWPVPTASSIETQTKTYCQQGATGVIFYDWSSPQSPLNNTSIAQGVKAGIADCKSIWSSQTTVTPTPTFAAGSTTVNVTVCPHGFGNCGDNVSPNGGGGNIHPKHSSKTVSLTFSNSATTATFSGNVLYNTTSSNFQGVVGITTGPLHSKGNEGIGR